MRLTGRVQKSCFSDFGPVLFRAIREPQEIVFCSRHKGFCRLAIEQGAALVPVLSLGEIFSLKNAFNIPTVQKLTYKKIGFPIPYLLVGRWGLSPLPKKVPLMYIVGEPIEPPKIQPGNSCQTPSTPKLICL